MTGPWSSLDGLSEINLVTLVSGMGVEILWGYYLGGRDRTHFVPERILIALVVEVRLDDEKDFLEAFLVFLESTRGLDKLVQELVNFLETDFVVLDPLFQLGVRLVDAVKLFSDHGLIFLESHIDPVLDLLIHLELLVNHGIKLVLVDIMLVECVLGLLLFSWLGLLLLGVTLGFTLVIFLRTQGLILVVSIRRATNICIKSFLVLVE